MKEVEFKVSYHNGTAEHGRLDLFDAGRSLQGLARAVYITTHAFLNEGSVRKHGDRVHGARLYLQAPKHGSFMENLTVAFEEESVEKVGKSVIIGAFYDFMKWTWDTAVGRKAAPPETPYVQRNFERKEPFLGDISMGLETALHDLHRPLEDQRNMVIVMQRPRGGEILRLDEDTMLHVTPRIEENLTEGIIGNVTRYNALSGYGRLFDDEEKRVISFDLAPRLDTHQKSILSESLHQFTKGEEGKIELDVRRVLTARGALKRYTVHAVRKLA